MIPGILLAAGASRRMRGTDKLMQEVDGMPLIRRQAALLRSVCAPVIVALPVPPHPRHDALEGLDVLRCPVPEAGEGMNASLRTAAAALPGDAPGAMLLLADLPALTEADLNHVLEQADFTSETLIWRGATQDGRPGHPVIFAAPLFAALRALRGDGGARDVVRAAGARLQLVPLPEDRARRDLDTPEDWAAWRAEQG